MQYYTCNECFDALANYNTDVLRTWLNLVELFQKVRIYHADPEELGEPLMSWINDLEVLGYLKTIDFQSGFLMQLNGIHPHHQYKNKANICINPKLHQSRFI